VEDWKVEVAASGDETTPSVGVSVLGEGVREAMAEVSEEEDAVGATFSVGVGIETTGSVLDTAGRSVVAVSVAVAGSESPRYSVEMTLLYWSTQMTAFGAVTVTTSVMVE
jgi:hypothetical protein